MAYGDKSLTSMNSDDIVLPRRSPSNNAGNKELAWNDSVKAVTKKES
jgi:hypothetical protein